MAPFRGLCLKWAFRGAVALALIGVALLALQHSESTVTVVVPTAVPPTAMPLPTQTPQPITSIIVRQTLAPFPTATPGPSNQVSVVDFSYMPGVVRINAGQSVFWRNDGTEQHDVTGADWHSGPLDPGYTYRLTFGLPGTYPYRCTIHLDMTGSVIVT